MSKHRQEALFYAFMPSSRREARNCCQLFTIPRTERAECLENKESEDLAEMERDRETGSRGCFHAPRAAGRNPGASILKETAHGRKRDGRDSR